MLHTFVLVVHTLIAASLVAVILMQRSEGGGLGMGQGPAGLMSARGAANFLTRATAILAGLFIATSIGLAVLASLQRAPRTIDTSLARDVNAGAPGAADQPAPLPGTTPPAVPLADVSQPVVQGTGAVKGPVAVNSAAKGGTSTTVGTSKTAAREPAAPKPLARVPVLAPAAPRLPEMPAPAPAPAPTPAAPTSGTSPVPVAN